MKIRCSLSFSFLSIGNLFYFLKRNKKNEIMTNQKLDGSSAINTSNDPNAPKATLVIPLLVPNNTAHEPLFDSNKLSVGSGDSLGVNNNFPLPQPLGGSNQNSIFITSSDPGFNPSFNVSRDMNPNANLGNQNFPLPQPLGEADQNPVFITINSNRGSNASFNVSHDMNSNANANFVNQNLPLPQPLGEADQNPVFITINSNRGSNASFNVSRDMNSNANANFVNQNLPLPQPITNNNGSIIISSAPSNRFSDYDSVPSVIVKTKISSMPRVLSVRRVGREESLDGKQWAQQI